MLTFDTKPCSTYVKLLLEVAGVTIDEVFMGSCLANIGHLRAAGKPIKTFLIKSHGTLPTRLSMALPIKMDRD